MGNPRQPRRRSIKGVTLAQCRGGRCVGLFEGERVVVLTFRHSGSETDPVGLQLPEARRLVSELIRVLLAYGDDYAFVLARAAWNSGVGAAATALDDPRTCPSCQGVPAKLRDGCAAAVEGAKGEAVAAGRGAEWADPCHRSLDAPSDVEEREVPRRLPSLHQRRRRRQR